MKAVFLFNFALFTEWPADWPAAKQTHIAFCVLGMDPFGDALDALAGKAIGEKPVLIKRLSRLDEAKRCHVLFVPESEAASIPSLVRSLAGQSTLTVAETPSALKQGVIIGLWLEDDRLTFEVNGTAAAKAGLNISSKLLRLAKAVHWEDK